MPRMPGAVWQPLADNWAAQPRMRAYDIICIHTMVGGLTGTDGYFRKGNGVGYAGTESHFGTGGGGEIVQWQDTAYQADANLNGNWHVLSIENADMGPGFPAWNINDAGQIPAFTEAQMDAIARIIAWACREYDIPCSIIPDARPGRRGIGWHRQGVPGYMIAGAEQWSTANRKSCPGDRRIAQIPEIVRRANVLLGQAPAPAPAPAPTPPGGGSSFRAKYGERGDHVLRLQQFMTRTFRSYNAYAPTGYYGDSTKAGLAEFQRRVGITGAGSDGTLVGPQTAAALVRYGFRG